jgi:hypothetical protein
LSKKKDITLSVHRAVIRDECAWSLSELFGSIRENGTTNRVVDRGFWDRTAVNFPQFPRTNEAVAAQFALYEEGAERSTVKREASSGDYSTTPVAAPDMSEFLNHEVAVLASGNYFIACGLGNRQSLLIDVIGQLAAQSKIAFPPGCMSLATIPNRLTVEMIRSRGVKSIKFDAANLLGSLDVSSQGVIESLFGSSSDVTKLKREEMIAELSLKPRKIGRRSDLNVVETPKDEWLGKAAVKVHNEDRINSYTIVLDDDTEWTEGQLKLTKSVSVSKDGSSYQMAEALQKMLEYMTYLREAGHLT